MASCWSEFLATDANFCLTVAPLEKGLILSGIAVISETQLFGKRVYQRRRKTKNDTERAPLHRLGTDKWSKVKQKAAEKASDVAAELLEMNSQWID